MGKHDLCDTGCCGLCLPLAGMDRGDHFDQAFCEALISTSLWTMIPLAARNTAERSWGIAFFTLLSNLAMLVSAPIVGKMASQLSWLAAGAALAVVAALGAVTAGLYRNDPKC